MHFLKQLRFIAALLAAFFVLSLTACGSGSNSFTWFVDSIPANLDPQVASSASDIIACENLYSGLVRRTPDGSLAPELCERWEVSADRLTYTFYLKDGLTYTASKGDPTDYAITAEDFVFAFQRMFLPGTNSPYAVEFSALENSAAVLAGQKPASALGVTAMAAMPLAPIIAGFGLEWVGRTGTLMVAGAICLIAVVLTFATPSIRALPKESEWTAHASRCAEEA